jgi:tetratricopeptide (TPR) repeat protein
MTSSRKRAPKFRRLIVIVLCLAAFGVALLAFRSVIAGRADPDAARVAVGRAEAFLNDGNATAARSQALGAVQADPSWGNAHAVLARSLLALGDGIGAEAELRRAIDAGYDPKQVPQWMAHALLLQGDAERAMVETDKALPEHRAYTMRIRARGFTALGNFAAARDSALEAVKLAPNDAGAWTDLGRFRYTVGDVVGAIEASARAVQLGKGDVAALVLRGELVRTQFGLVAALPWFESALQRDPYAHDALIEYAATLGDIGRTNDMLAATRRALEARPGSPQALYLQAVLAARAENFDLARSLMQRTGGGVADLPGALLLGGTLDIEAGGYEQGIEKLRQLVGMQPMNITARKLLATALLRSDAARNAIDMLRPVVARGDADSYAYALVGRGFERIGERDAAGQFLDRASMPVRGNGGAFSSDDTLPVLGAAAQQTPDDPQATIPLIRGLLDAGNTPGALAKAQAIARDNPGAPASQILVGDVLMLMDRPGDAAAAYRQAADIRFDEPVLLRLVEALDRSGHRDDAANTLALFLSQNPANVAALRLAAHWQLAAGEYADAVETLEALKFRVGTRDVALLAELAFAYAGAGNADAARAHAEAAYLLAPMNAAAADAYGWTLYEAGDLGGALPLLQKAVSIAPHHAVLRWHLAQAYADAGRKPEARLHAQAALADPSFGDRDEAQALLGEMG